jgi:predicted nucleic acid-binding protein
LIVIDASVALAWHFPGEGGDDLDNVLNEVLAGGAIVPIHWRAEVANSFAMAVRHARITADYRTTALEKLSQLEIETDQESHQQLWHSTQTICDQYEVSAYDGAYLELALRRGVPLATLDRRLDKAARYAGAKLRLERP